MSRTLACFLAACLAAAPASAAPNAFSLYDPDDKVAGPIGAAPAGRLSGLEHGIVGGATASTFAYNPASQLSGETRTNDAYAWTGSVAVDRPYSVNGQNQYTAAGSASFAYDLNGNLVWDGSTSFLYDVENRLVSASGAKTAALVYDPLGRLFQVSSPATGTTRFLHDGDELVAEYDGAGTMLRRYIHGDGSDDPLYWYEGAGLTQPRFPHADRQGSIVATAEPGGLLLSINTYDEYGIPGASQAAATSVAQHGRFQYTGQAWIPELGMYYYKARIYSPTLGRFLQVDPIGYEGGINLYAYVENDPVNQTDPSGNVGVFGAVIGGGIELGLQLSTRQGRAAYVNAGRALARGDLRGAVRSAGKPLLKVAVSAGAGAVGMGVSGKVGQAANRLSTGFSPQVGRTLNGAARGVGNAAAGAAIGAGSKVTNNGIDGRPLTENVRGAAIGGGIGGGVGSTAGNFLGGAAQRGANASGNFIGASQGVAVPSGSSGVAAERIGTAAGAAAERASCAHTQKC